MASNHKAALESRVLSGPPPACAAARVIDFKETEVKEYADYFAMVINDILMPEECAELVSLAQPAHNAPWPPAKMTAYNGSQILDPSSRHCGRIIYNSKAVADRLLNRILPHLPPEVATLDNVPDITGQMPVIRKEKWKISRFNEALKFLKYERGNCFRPHCDAHYEDKETGEKSSLTAHFYLNGGNRGEDTVEGGATRFAVDFADPNAGKVDVNPKAGSVLIFQQRDMYHEGAGVNKGVKYTMRADVMYKKV
ncbi:hypothetical protein DL766_003221 [Monosporascus sp. MC13-8B]|uniref:Prolyl 4-hydroxylase alpha subunit domain-containing protein n=1 Tax=Monosporascus cannonballus TaxID=155416 RepID=A0ABY0GZD4_9PEZI|nr:hypothetical protein DL762_007723 [Monosporascus cannonballus]RYO92514.1 hypothetical protein DL763_004643 [Monosporascus cannonballus]RYP33949.1 hypothetical protein DL766_003221 [Monosporascus sp. MC13-8B]